MSTLKSVTVSTLQKMKVSNDKIAMLTAYDACFAAAQQRSGIDVILVGDSLGMVLQGNESTLPVTIDDMVYHTKAVSAGVRQEAAAYAASATSPATTVTNTPLKRPLIIADMPFMGCSTLEQTLRYSTKLMQAGAHMVKLEGEAWLAEPIQQLARGGIPVCAHLGLTPQSVNALGGYKVQGRGDAGEQLLNDALALEKAGAAMILVECIPTELGKQLSKQLTVPVIGIGAGPDCDGQVLVMHDMLGVTPGKPAKFVQNFMEENRSIDAAFQDYVTSVKQGTFPKPIHCFD